MKKSALLLLAGASCIGKRCGAGDECPSGEGVESL